MFSDYIIVLTLALCHEPFVAHNSGCSITFPGQSICISEFLVQTGRVQKLILYN